MGFGSRSVLVATTATLCAVTITACGSEDSDRRGPERADAPGTEAQPRPAAGVARTSARRETTTRTSTLAKRPARARTTTPGRPVTLKGSAAPRARHDAHWRVLSKPADSKATVARPGPRVPFKPDVPGHYQLALGSGASAERVTITAQATDDPMGVGIQTITQSGAIAIGTPGTGGKVKTYHAGGNWLNVLVVDSATLRPNGIGSKGYNFGDAGASELKNDIVGDGTSAHPGVGRNDLVMVSGQGRGVPGGKMTTATHSALQSVFDHIGATDNTRGATFDGIDSFAEGDWSVIGQARMPTGSAWQSFRVRQKGVHGFLRGEYGQRGTLNGYLQKIVGTGYGFVSSEFATLDTSAGTDPSRNTIKVGDQSYTSEPLGGGRAMGVHLLELDGSGLDRPREATYVLRKPDGSVDANAIRGLAASLAVSNDPTPSQHDPGRFEPPLVIVQSFGDSSGAGVPAVADNNAWVNDQLPDWGVSGHNDDELEFYKWCGDGGGGGLPRCKDPFPNSTTGLGGANTVTQAVGRMAGMPARTSSANFGRNAPEAMSFVGSAHPYSDSDATFRTGKHATQVVGTLRRTNQSQWEVSVPAAADQLATGSFWEVAMGPRTPWPMALGSGQDSEQRQAIAAAHEAVIEAVWPGDAVCRDVNVDPCVTDVRDEYIQHYSDDDWSTFRAKLHSASLPSDAPPAQQQAFDQLKPILTNEFEQIAELQNLFPAYSNIFKNAGQDVVLNLGSGSQSIAGQVMQAAFTEGQEYHSELEREVTVLNTNQPFSDALYLASDIFDVFEVPEAGGPLSLLASAWDLYSSLSGADDASKASPPPHPVDYPHLIETQAGDLGAQLESQYQNLEATFDHLLSVYVTDPDKLATAAANASSDAKWDMQQGSDQEKVLSRAIAMSTNAAFYEALLPIAYEQWFLAPVFTSTGNEGPKDVTSAGPKDYHCDDGPNPFESRPPRDPVPDSSLHWVRFEQTAPHGGNATPNDSNYRNHYVGRGLKSRSYPMRLTGNDSDAGHFQYTDTVSPDEGYQDGRSPSGDMMDKLFQPPTSASNPNAPDGLSMTKDNLFGLTSWKTPRLMCGYPLDKDYPG